MSYICALATSYGIYTLDRVLITAEIVHGNRTVLFWITQLGVRRREHFYKTKREPLWPISQYVHLLRDHLGVARGRWRPYGQFTTSSCGVAVLNHRYLSSSETSVNDGTRRWKLHVPQSTWCQESIGGICFTNKGKAPSARRSSGFDSFKPTLKCRYFQMHISWVKSSFFFLSEHRGFLKKKRESRFFKWHQCRLLTRHQPFFFFLHIYTLCWKLIDYFVLPII